jgi:exopolysaccharide biosynthesis polyprenyl glycosylphosphotransferase
MYNKQVYLIVTTLMVVDGLLFIGAGYLSAYALLQFGYAWVDNSMVIGTILTAMFLNNFIMSSINLYSERRSPNFFTTVKKLFISVAVNMMILNVILFSLHAERFFVFFLLLYGGVVFVALVIERALLEGYLEKRQRSGFNARTILLVGSNRRAMDVYYALDSQKSWGHQFIGVLEIKGEDDLEFSELPNLGYLEDLKSTLKDRSVDEVIFALPPDYNHDIKDYLDICDKMGVMFRIVPALYNPAGEKRLQAEDIQGVPMLSRPTVNISPSGLLYKRVMDYAFGGAAFLVLMLLYPFVAAAIKLDSPGPVFFKQPRMGQNGRIFQMYKFRSMYIDAEERKKELMDKNQMQGLMFKLEEDPRITRVGVWLRKTSLDELPQVINVMRGEMSVVGTRPPTLDETERYEPWQRRRLSIRPGITGLWQVSGRNQIRDFDEVVRLDLKYIDEWTVTTDLKILAKTVWVVLKRKGAV